MTLPTLTKELMFLCVCVCVVYIKRSDFKKTSFHDVVLVYSMSSRNGCFLCLMLL